MSKRKENIDVMLCTHISCRSSKKCHPKTITIRASFHWAIVITTITHRALFLVVRTIAFHCKAWVPWKYVINHVRNFWMPQTTNQVIFSINGPLLERLCSLYTWSPGWKNLGQLWAFWACCLAPKLLLWGRKV